MGIRQMVIFQINIFVVFFGLFRLNWKLDNVSRLCGAYITQFLRIIEKNRNVIVFNRDRARAKQNEREMENQRMKNKKKKNEHRQNN